MFLLAALGCSTTPILIGYDLTLVGSIIANKEFVKTFGTYDEAVGALVLPANQQLVWTIVQFVAAAAWALGAGALNDFLGRRICFFITVMYVKDIVAPHTPTCRSHTYWCNSAA